MVNGTDELANTGARAWHGALEMLNYAHGIGAAG